MVLIFHLVFRAAPSGPATYQVDVYVRGHKGTCMRDAWHGHEETMQAAKEKGKDMASAVKEKVKKHSAKAEEKVEETTARSREEKEMARERGKAREAQAKAELHDEKAGHREETAAHRGTHVPLTGLYHNRPVGTAAAPTRTTDPTYPASGGRPAGEKYL
ncbi:uncharacterized protein [Elaeis guineensis]